jgi:ribonuclease HI
MKKQAQEIVIYTDGACSGNPGPGGWGAVLLYGEHNRELNGYEPETTNQRMEVKAAVEALKALKVSGWMVTLYSDSAYLVNAYNQKWLEKWQSNGWINSKKDEVANQDLWQELLLYLPRNFIRILKVKGHSGDKLNDRCDELARDAIQQGRQNQAE